VPAAARSIGAEAGGRPGRDAGAVGPGKGVEALVAYYANSYVCVPEDSADEIAWSEYDGRRFAASVRRANTWGMQFHPEKSSDKGRRIVANFVALAREARR